jgi:hypothetical protein
MLKIELVPDLSHCIETAAKQKYAEVVRQLLSSGAGDEKLCARAELLRNFLETADFKKLREESERHLLRGRSVSFLVYLEDGIVKHDMRTQVQPHEV